MNREVIVALYGFQGISNDYPIRVTQLLMGNTRFSNIVLSTLPMASEGRYIDVARYINKKKDGTLMLIRRHKRPTSILESKALLIDHVIWLYT